MRRLLPLLILVACGSSPRAPGEPVAKRGVVASNALRADYAGSRACTDCHGDVEQKWQHSPMHNMTRDAATATIRAPFDGTTFTVNGDRATMEMQGGARFVTTVLGGKTARYRVTKVVGGRYREDFVGIDVTNEPDPMHGGIGVERVLPATFVFSTMSWRYKGYSVMVKERPGMSTRAVWANDCIPCHNTLPLATMLYDELYGPSLPAYQGKLSDRVLPTSLVWTARSRDDAGLAAALREEIKFLGGVQPSSNALRDVLPAAAVASQTYLDGPKLVELGVGCEACHNGAAAHAADPAVLPSYAVQSTLLQVSPPGGGDGSRAQWINRTCAKCHTVLFTRYPWTWEGGERKRNPGGSTTNSGEGRDFQLGGCATQMTCTTCHDPHAADPAAALAELATTKGNRLCVGCHQKYAAPAAQLAHSHHKDGDGSACIGCHMPKKNMGLDYHLVRYHRIGSPTDRDRATKDRPLECALCHAGKSTEALATTMDSWYGTSTDRAALRALYGDDLSRGNLIATLQRGKPHEQAVAIATLGAAKITSAVPAIATALAHEYPLVRFFAQRALELITGQRVPIELSAPAATIRPQIDAWLTQPR